jgi:hypothetical protein
MPQKPLEIEEDLERLPSVTQILTAVGVLPVYPDTEAARWARAWGEYLHKLLAKIAIGEQLSPDVIVTQAEPYIAEWREWLGAARTLGYEVIAAEKPVCHQVDGFSGRVDLLLKRGDNGWWVVELKTGRPHPAHRLQTAAYVHALGRFDLDDCITQKSYRWDDYRRGALYLSPPKWQLREHNDAGDYAAWASALRLYRWKRQKYYDKLGKSAVMEI